MRSVAPTTIDGELATMIQRSRSIHIIDACACSPGVDDGAVPRERRVCTDLHMPSLVVRRKVKHDFGIAFGVMGSDGIEMRVPGDRAECCAWVRRRPGIVSGRLRSGVCAGARLMDARIQSRVVDLQ